MICPTCKRTFDRPAENAAEGQTFGPFCSARCRTVDLGNWLDGAYRISAPFSEEDLEGGAGPSSASDEETPTPN
jgi:endogenous inhibitor of DNA gyrase (YacG/DUF329 family)